MEHLHPTTIAFNRFMEWFKEHEPALYIRYQGNVDPPAWKGGKVTINNAYRISPDNRQMLIDIVKKYYKEQETN